MAHIYIVDDEREMLMIESIYLKATHKVEIFNSGKDVLDALEHDEPDLILLDIEMPFMDGFEVLRQIRSMGRHVPVIGVTGKNERATILKFISAGAEGYVLKPSDKIALNEAVNDILAKYGKSSGKKTLLILASEPDRLIKYKTYLNVVFQVVALNSSKAAIEYMQKYEFDTLVMDYDMPLFNGKFVNEYMQGREELKNKQIVFIVDGKEQEKEVLETCTNLSEDNVVQKNVGLDKILYAIQAQDLAELEAKKAQKAADKKE